MTESLPQKMSGVEVTQLKGIVDTANSSTIKNQITDIVNTGVSTILIDCTDITFMNSAGLSTLVMLLKLSKQKGIRLCLCSIQDQVELLFNSTGMDRVFEIFEDTHAFFQTL
ncbi:anti-sigma factor antagonist [Leptolyngbyaceae cyanobacterium CCMR0081]|uniref:Anti-sigma factor antagonist n=2 Tax=Adonisia TaxID=2950183 RepID=A0A6M0RS62_9CYAN|nr:anti-sigma factor antagonist [Adonisia turfae CCMR0081]